MTLGQAKSNALMLIDEYSTRGTVNTNGNIADYKLKFNSYFDIGQKHVAEDKNIKKAYDISHYLPFTPTEAQFESVPHTDTDLIYSSGTGYAYHFSVDDRAEVYIEGIIDGVATELDFISAYSENGFTAYKGLIYSDGVTYDSIQLRFSGDNFYHVKDVVIFTVNYSMPSKIPNFARYIKYEMPSDFMFALNAKIRTKTNYEQLKEFTWENPNTIAVSVYEQGEIRIEYAASPATITENTPDTYKFEIGEYEQGAMIYYVAALCLQHTNLSVYSLLMQQYAEKMINSKSNAVLRQTRVKRVYNV